MGGEAAGQAEDDTAATLRSPFPFGGKGAGGEWGTFFAKLPAQPATF